MCTNPTLIKNPNKGLFTNPKVGLNFMKDTTSQYIPVPCGHCPECVRTRQLGLVQRCQMEAVYGWPFFITLTYNNESLPVLTCSDGREVRYADLSDVSNMFKRIRNNDLFGRPFRYFAVSELGSKRARPHFHILLYLQKLPSDNMFTPYKLESELHPLILSQWKRNYAKRLTKNGKLVADSRHPDYRPLCTYVSKVICGKIRTNYELHYVSPSPLNGSSADVSFYVTKYMLKPSDKSTKLQQALRLNLDEDEYDSVWNLVKPRWFSSLNFGFGVYGLQAKGTSPSVRYSVLSQLDTYKYVRECVKRSSASEPFPKYYDSDTGKAMAFSRYWMHVPGLYTDSDALSFYYNNSKGRVDNLVVDDRPLDSKLHAIETHKKRLAMLDTRSDLFDLLED